MMSKNVENSNMKENEGEPLMKFNVEPSFSREQFSLNLEIPDSDLLTIKEMLIFLSENIDEALKPYNAAMRIVFEEGKYAQIILNFCEGQIPDTVIIEV